VNRCSQALKRHERENGDLKLKKQRAHQLVEQLKDELETLKPQDGKLEALQGQLQEAEEEHQMNSSQYQDAVVEKDKLNETLRDLKTLLDDMQKEVEEANVKVNKAELKIRKLEEKRHAALLQKNVAFQLVDDAQRDKEQMIQRRNTQMTHVQTFIEQAEQVSARVPVDPRESLASLDRKLDRIAKDIENQQRQ
jgi:structural maintenance of chromosomes protein 6